jgi:hypothetical protein
MSQPSAGEPLAQGGGTNPAGRDVPADEAPAGPATLPYGVVRPWSGPDRLVLLTPTWLRILGFVLLPCLLLVPSVILVFVVGVEARISAGWPLARKWAFGTALVLFGTLTTLWMAWVWYRQFILPRVTFDKEKGVVALGWRTRRGRRPLSSVVGVQVLSVRKPAPDLPGYAQYQLNLLLDDPTERRLNVTTCGLETARSLAQLVADFLGVPVLDSTGRPNDSGVPGPTRKGEPG